MRKVALFSLLLIAGLALSQVLQGTGELAIRMGTMICLSFIMIHVGYEFEIDKSKPKQYVWDYLVAGTAAAFPWIMAAAYFVWVMSPRELWGFSSLWKESLLAGRFASPTSAGVLFSMLAAAGLAGTWLFRKARVLAIFDDLDTILLMVPLKMMMVGNRWQLWMIVGFIVVMLVLAWRHLHRVKMPTSWPFVLAYSVAIVAVSEAIYMGSKRIDPVVPIHLEVLLPAFVLGCMMARPAGADPHGDDAREGHQEGPESPREQRVATMVSASFMLLVGLSMPPIWGDAAAPPVHTEDIALMPAVTDAIDKPAPTPGEAMPGAATTGPVAATLLDYSGADPAALAERGRFPGWGVIAMHVVILTVLINLGKMFPAFCYRREATGRQRLALAVGMFPRGEVGAGVLVVSLSYGIGGPIITVAVLSLALNLLCTGVFIVVVKKLLAGDPPCPTDTARLADSSLRG